MEVKNKKKYFKPYNKVNDKHVTIMWDYKPIFKANAKGEQIESPLATWQEHTFNHIPTLSEIKAVITDYYNKLIDQSILSGLVWNGMKVWLSSENQFNYKVAYDLAVQSNGATLPIVFKFGDDEETVYYEFKTIEELSNFYITSINYVQTVLQEGWNKKDKINWDIYK
jgi:hypothetical protein